MAELTESVSRLIGELSQLPGVGKKSAERMAYHLLKVEKDEAMRLADAIRHLKENVRNCRDCFHLAEEELCEICRDTSRNPHTLCVVEQPRDLLMLEESGVYHGLYHVLLGRLSPLDRIGPEHLTIDALVTRVASGKFTEVIMATNPTLDGDNTAFTIIERLAGFPVKITRLARGIVSGSDLQFANKEMLADAMNGRQSLG
ncbi:MAG: recombination mediator RecR [Thermoguttaceae bacterium]